MHLFEEAKRAMEEISQEADFVNVSLPTITATFGVEVAVIHRCPLLSDPYPTDGAARQSRRA